MPSQNALEFFSQPIHIICPQIILNKKSLNTPKLYQGSGSITRSSSGQLKLELACADDNTWSSLLEFITEIGEEQGDLVVVNDQSVGIGKIVPETEYFSLTAIDCQGREWTSTRVLIHERRFQNNQVLIAQLDEICHTAQLVSNEDAYIYLKLSGELKIPCNRVMQTEEELLGLHVAIFSACGYNFIIKPEAGGTLIEVNSKCNYLPDLIESRICEALQFVLGDLVSWSTLELNQANQQTIRIRTSFKGINQTKKICPPIRFEKVDITEDIWILYEKYLYYILNYNEKELHPISGWVSRIIEARTTYLEVEMLTLSVAIESLLEIQLLKKEFMDNNSSNLKSQILLVQEQIKALALEESFKKRLYGFFSNMNSVSATDRLRDLVDKKLLDKKLVDAWKQIRNKAAHGYILEPEKLEIF